MRCGPYPVNPSRHLFLKQLQSSKNKHYRWTDAMSRISHSCEQRRIEGMPEERARRQHGLTQRTPMLKKRNGKVLPVKSLEKYSQQVLIENQRIPFRRLFHKKWEQACG